MPNFRTDLAMEAFDGQGRDVLPGVEVNRWEEGGVALTEVIVKEAEAANALGKPCGRYLTLECAQLRRRDPDARLAVQGLLSDELSRMLPEAESDAPALVVGLGNRQITPDALGPSVVERTLVTRHLTRQLGSFSDLCPVCAVAPGVLGVTGIETMDVVECLTRLVRPSVVICVDSLAARDSRRLGATLQLTDTGIQPGAGVGNHRRALTRESVGAPVIAVGMPTVVYAATLASDALEYLRTTDNSGAVCDDPSDVEKTLLGAELGEMIVTPREIDALIQDASGLIAGAINRALQPALSDAEIAAMMG